MLEASFFMIGEAKGLRIPKQGRLLTYSLTSLTIFVCSCVQGFGFCLSLANKGLIVVISLDKSLTHSLNFLRTFEVEFYL